MVKGSAVGTKIRKARKTVKITLRNAPYMIKDRLDFPICSDASSNTVPVPIAFLGEPFSTVYSVVFINYIIPICTNVSKLPTIPKCFGVCHGWLLFVV